MWLKDRFNVVSNKLTKIEPVLMWLKDRFDVGQLVMVSTYIRKAHTCHFQFNLLQEVSGLQVEKLKVQNVDQSINRNV